MKLLLPLFPILLASCSSNDTPPVVEENVTPRTQKISDTWIGKWERQLWQTDAGLEITNINGDSLFFKLNAFSGGHIGEIDGMAIVTGDIARFSTNEDHDSCLIEFKLIGDSIITIAQKKGNCFAAMSVTYSGEYKNVKFSTGSDKATLKNLGIFKNEKEDLAFKSLVGNSYSLFVNSTQLTTEAEDLDGINATVRSSGVRGLFTLMENIIMNDTLSNIWAAVIDDNKVYYFTNNKQYKKRLPKTIDNWRRNFNTYEVIYK